MYNLKLLINIEQQLLTEIIYVVLVIYNTKT